MRKECLWLTALYCFAHVPLLLTSGLFHDDFGLFRTTITLNDELLWATGRPLYGYFLSLVFLPGTVLVPRVVTFLSYLISGLLLRNVLKTLDVIKPEERFFVVAFFMLFPADSTRVMLILSYYAFSHLLFFLGFWLLTRYEASGKLVVRAGALCFFLLSFGLMSLMCFYGLVILYLGYVHRKGLNGLRSLVALILSYVDFLVLPFIYWVLRSLIFPPYAAYAGYFQLDLSFLLPRALASAIRGAVASPMLHAFLDLQIVSFLLVLVAAGLLFLAWRKTLAVGESEVSRCLLLFGLGCVALFLALVPYLVGRKIPDHWDWLSRHAMLVPLAVGLMLYYGIRVGVALVRIPKHVTLFLYCLLICVFIAGNVSNYVAYWLDWDKSLALTQLFQKNDVVRHHTNFLIRDDSEDWNAKKKYLRFYEYAALTQMAFGDESRFIQLERFWKGPEDLEGIAFLVRGGHFGRTVPGYASLYNLNDWVPKQPEYRLIIRPSRPKPAFLEAVKLKYQEVLDPTAFTKSLNGLLELSTEKLANNSPH
jgi:hypothetical protein